MTVWSSPAVRLRLRTNDAGRPLADIFLSYSRTDKPLAEPLVAALAAKGWSVWWDMDLEAGSDFDRITSDALESAKAVIVVWTPTSVNSRWVRGEARVGADRGVLVPVRFENAKLPIDVRAIHTTDLDGWEGDPKSGAFSKLEQSLTALLKASSPLLAEAFADAQPPLRSRPSIAVMPFANLSSDPEQDYFADGMMDEIVTALTRNRSLFVIASGSTMALKGQTISAKEIGRQLAVQYLLEGSVRRGGPRVRIAVKLIDTSDGAQVWAEKFDDTLEDVFALQDNVALSVAAIVEPTVHDSELRKLSRRPTDNLGSYDLYLRATPLFWSFAKSDMIEVLSLLERAIALDPEFGLAHAISATCHRVMFEFGWSDDPEGHRAKGTALANRALKLASDDARALAHVASALLGLEPSLVRATDVIDRALRLNPGCAYAWLVSGLVRVRLGEAEMAISLFETALRLDPLSSSRPTAQFGIAVANFQLGRLEAALPILAENPLGYMPFSLAVLASALGHIGRTQEAREVLARYATIAPKTIASQAPAWFHSPRDRAFLLNGIALAESGSSG